jgi:N-hydroxyarylamine O-acetyltransferase
MATGSLAPARVHVDDYLRRIAYAGDLRPSAAVLDALHLAHATHIPFENLDVLLRRPIKLDLGSLQAKLVDGRRGGYCFEQNLLFAAVLEELGFPVLRLAARVRFRIHRVLPRTHMLLLVDVDGRRLLADVGFGAEGLLLPVPFGTGMPAKQFLWTYQVVDAGGRWALQSEHHGSWETMYEFTLEPQELADYEMANYYTSTHPSSRFLHTLTAQLSTPDARTRLRNRELVVERGDSESSRLLADDAEIRQVLADTFGLEFPAGTAFPFREGEW